VKINIKKIKSQISEETRREQRIRMRIKIVTLFVGFIFLVVIGRAVELHCIEDSSLGWVASKQYNAKLAQSFRRGRILDREGRELAVSQPVPSIYADPRATNLTEEQKTLLIQILGIKKEDLNDKLKSPKKFVWLKRMVEPSVAEQVKEIPGIYSVEESKRFYPNGSLASHLLGAVGFDSEALAGLELANDRYLSSKKEETVYKRDARGKFYYSPLGYQDQDDVNDLYLTLDKQVQFVTEEALKKAVEMANAKGGTAIVMDVETGAILAMANKPFFDPNNYSKYPQETWRNRAITDTVEPGSTFKVLIVSAALDTGLVKEDSVYDCGRGAITIGNATLHDHSSYDKLSVRDIIKVSSNIGAYKIAKDVGKEKIYEALKKFGIGLKTGVDYPGEVEGIVRKPSSWQPVEFATIAFGQGISVTPIQMVTAFASIANSGKLMRPYVIEKIVNNQGITVAKNVPTIVSEPIDPETANLMISMLEGVVGEGGTGVRAASKEYPVAGKTGTAQKVVSGAKHYVEGKYYSSFIGIAPSNDPKVAIFVGLDEPRGEYYGGLVSAPVFKEITEVTLKHLDVPSAMSKVVVVDPTAKTPAVNFSQVERQRFQKVDSSNFVVPDVRGIGIRDVMNLVGQADIKVKISGSGTAIDQMPAPGSLIKEGETFFVSFRQPN
jgi:cell division protein FtsI (penicillin-binding protein 3)